MRARADLAGLGPAEGPIVTFDVPRVAARAAYGAPGTPEAEPTRPKVSYRTWTLLVMLIGATAFVVGRKNRQ